MSIEHSKEDRKGCFKFIDFYGATIGTIEYKIIDESILVIIHTEVAIAYSGQGIGRELIFAVVAYARENQMKIFPLCPFARYAFNEIKSIQDVLSV